MSPNVGNFVHDLVEMAKAMETLPQVQAENERLQKALDTALQNVQNRELALIASHEENDRLIAKVRATEAERDDAELRFLDLEEKSAKVVSFLAQVQGMAVQAEVLLNPPKPQPEPVVEQPPVPEAVQSIEPQPHGQGEVNPTNHVTEPTTSAYSNAARHSDVGNTVEAPKPSSPYTGKLYHNHPVYVSLHDWIDGGGTERDWYWRPATTNTGSF